MFCPLQSTLPQWARGGQWAGSSLSLDCEKRVCVFKNNMCFTVILWLELSVHDSNIIIIIISASSTKCSLVEFIQYPSIYNNKCLYVDILISFLWLWECLTEKNFIYSPSCCFIVNCQTLWHSAWFPKHFQLNPFDLNIFLKYHLRLKVNILLI